MPVTEPQDSPSPSWKAFVKGIIQLFNHQTICHQGTCTVPDAISVTAFLWFSSYAKGNAGHYVMVRKRPKYVMKIFPAQIYRWNWRENNMQSVRLGMWLYNKYVLTQTNAAVAIAKMHSIRKQLTRARLTQRLYKNWPRPQSSLWTPTSPKCTPTKQKM